MDKKFFQLIPSHTNFDFIGKFKIFVVISLVTVGVTISAVFTKGFNFGIDFTGGTSVQVRFEGVESPESVRKLVADSGEPNAVVVALGNDGREYLITARSANAVGAQDTLAKRLRDKSQTLTVLKVDVVGPKVGSELKRAAILSLIYSIILIMIYIWFRFDFRFAPGATIAMIHDIILASGFYLFTGEEFTITSIAALLTIAGYSVNDTIVIYDRVRELIKVGGDALPLPLQINRAINLTLSRTLLTSGVTLISVLPLVIYCDGEIQAFAKAMCVGIFVGSYSTIYIAAPFTIYAQKFLERKKTLVPTTR